jgi:hypothetical protein
VAAAVEVTAAAVEVTAAAAVVTAAVVTAAVVTAAAVQAGIRKMNETSISKCLVLCVVGIRGVCSKARARTDWKREIL